ncbi:MAG: GNAT family N-acetyltransferase [Firmicutes bacterium]|nr:GNAT family N-acetyltransferase [Bacillota bacterium]
MEIRKATLADLDAIAALEAACFPEAEAASRDSFEKRLKVFADRFWLLWDGDRLVSMVNGMVTDQEELVDEMFADANMHQPEGAWQMIFGVATHPEYQRRGLAAQVLERAIADVKAEGRRGLILTCKDFRIHYYAKFGFVSEGVSGSEHGGAKWYQMRLEF